jgi:uncharacterized protein (TIGR02594 family)
MAGNIAGMFSSPMDLAATQVGRSVGNSRGAIQEYLKNGGANLDPATTAWCAAFVNSSLGQMGLRGTGSNLAKSFLNFGQETKQPQRGDIAVFSRGDPNGPYGHVAFVDSLNPDGSVHVLGGNQGRSVSYADFPASRVLGFRHIDTAGGQFAGGSPTPPARPGAPGQTPLAGTSLAEALPGATLPGGAVAIPVEAPPDPMAVAAAGIAQQFQQRDAEEKRAAEARRTALFSAPGGLGSLYG